MPPIFLAFLDCFSSCSCFGCWLYCCCFASVLCLLWFGCGLWFSFPPDGMTKRKGAPCWCVLSSWVVGLFPLSYYLDSTAGDEIFHACHIVNRNKVSIPSVTVVIEANKRNIGSGCILYNFNFPISEVLPRFRFSVLF